MKIERGYQMSEIQPLVSHKMLESGYNTQEAVN